MTQTEVEASEEDRRTKPVGTKTTKDAYHRLRWLAYRGGPGTTVSSIVAGYVERCLEQEDFTGYEPPP